MEKILQDNIPEIQAMIADVGVPLARSGNSIGRNSGSHAANIQIALVSPEKRKRSSVRNYQSDSPETEFDSGHDGVHHSRADSFASC